MLPKGTRDPSTDNSTDYCAYKPKFSVCCPSHYYRTYNSKNNRDYTAIIRFTASGSV